MDSASKSRSSILGGGGCFQVYDFRTQHQKVEVQSWGGGCFQVYDFRTQHQKVEVQSWGGGGGCFQVYDFWTQHQRVEVQSWGGTIFRHMIFGLSIGKNNPPFGPAIYSDKYTRAVFRKITQLLFCTKLLAASQIVSCGD